MLQLAGKENPYIFKSISDTRTRLKMYLEIIPKQYECGPQHYLCDHLIGDIILTQKYTIEELTR